MKCGLEFKTLMEQTKNDLSVAVEDINAKLDPAV